MVRQPVGNLQQYPGGAVIREGCNRPVGDCGAGAGPDRVWRYTLEGRTRPSGFSISGSFEHSTSTWEEGGSTEADAIGLSVTGTMGSTWFNAIYSGSGIISRSLEVLYVYVGEGQGSYGYDPETGQYYPDPDGDYDIRYQPGGAGETVVKADLSVRFSSASTGSGLDGILELSSRNSGSRLETLLLAGAFRPGDPGGYNAELSPWLRWDQGFLRRLTLRGKLRDETIDYSGAGNRREREWLFEAAPEAQDHRDDLDEERGALPGQGDQGAPGRAGSRPDPFSGNRTRAGAVDGEQEGIGTGP